MALALGIHIDIGIGLEIDTNYTNSKPNWTKKSYLQCNVWNTMSVPIFNHQVILHYASLYMQTQINLQMGKNTEKWFFFSENFRFTFIVNFPTFAFYQYDHRALFGNTYRWQSILGTQYNILTGIVTQTLNIHSAQYPTIQLSCLESKSGCSCIPLLQHLNIYTNTCACSFEHLNIRTLNSVFCVRSWEQQRMMYAYA